MRFHAVSVKPDLKKYPLKRTNGSMRMRGAVFPFLTSIMTLFLLTAVPFLLPAAGKQQEVFFSGKARSGDRFEFSIHSVRLLEYVLVVPGAEKEALRTEGIDVSAKGILTLKKVNAWGSPLELDFRVDALRGKINGKTFDCANLRGRTVSADLTGTVPLFRLKEDSSSSSSQLGGNAFDPAAVLGGSSAASKSSGNSGSLSGDGKTDGINGENPSGIRLSPEAEIFLGTMFRPAVEEHLSDTLGTSCLLSLGEEWPIRTDSLLNTLKTRKIKAEKENIEGSAVLSARDRFAGIDCWKVNIKMESRGIQGYDFRFEAAVILPVDPSLGGAVRMMRQAKEVIDRHLPNDNPMSAGNVFKLISSDQTDIIMTPLSPRSGKGASLSSPASGKERKKSWWQF